MVSYGNGGLVVAHVGRRLLLGKTPRRCAMPRHNGKFCNEVSIVLLCFPFFFPENLWIRYTNKETDSSLA